MLVFANLHWAVCSNKSATTKMKIVEIALLDLIINIYVGMNG